ncbi:alpha-(1,3)-fucosyltransferase 10 isoform X2 [Thrips palmi]|uniref:Fucosyltransferase n=1 Tax=Thrips palmi TaxID=161013 RepID=A0A6P8ZLJ7_THRPL|nr:alpha-(1,3)-fucosyltransferase 10 isoform X2 [Thrips palmi]
MELSRSSVRCRTPLLLTCLLSLSFIFIQLLFQLWLEWVEDTRIPVRHLKLGKFSLKDCGEVRCFITQDRRFQHHPKFQMHLFYGSNIDIFDLPLPKQNNILWSLLHEESPKNVPFLSHKEGISLFNYTATFSRFSDVPLTLQYVSDIESITDHHYVVPIERKNSLLQHLSPVLYVQSDCDTPLDRDKYVQKLMEYIPIDSYGACLHNKELPVLMTNPMESFNSEEFLHFVAQYKFTIAFENAVCDDYITEKLWRPLTVGSVPIYLGSPSIEDWLPNQKSAVLASNFSSPKELAAYLLEINSDDEKYTAFLSHKGGLITNKYFVSELTSRSWGLPDNSHYHYIDEFECKMCLQAHLNANGHARKKVASQEEYFCPRPKSSITKQEDPSNLWLDLWEHGKCEATVLSTFIQNGHWYNASSFNSEVQSRFKKGTC